MPTTPKDAVIAFFRGWERRDFAAMISATEEKMLSEVVQPIEHFEKWFGFKSLLDWQINEAAVLGSHAVQYTVTIEYQTTARRYRHKLFLIVKNETPHAQYGDRRWGVNPISALREYEFHDA